ncbi:MAG: PIN domain-containing protein [Patescibacteria group bacterium]
MPIRIFVDSDVIISSLISRTGAAFLLMHDARIDRFISDVSFAELKRVVGVLHLSLKDLQKLVETQCNVVTIGESKRDVKRMTEFTRDMNDAHIVLGASKAKVKFLVTYNLKHYRIEKIREDLRIIVLPPAFLLQYLRSVN